MYRSLTQNHGQDIIYVHPQPSNNLSRIQHYIPIIPLSLFTVFTFKEAQVVCNYIKREVGRLTNLMKFCGSLVRFSAELPWTIVLLGIIGTLVTFVAWCKRPSSKPISDHDTHAIPSADTSRTETVVGDESLQQIESKGKNLEAATPY